MRPSSSAEDLWLATHLPTTDWYHGVEPDPTAHTHTHTHQTNKQVGAIDAQFLLRAHDDTARTHA